MATHNRADVVHTVLESYCALEQPPGGWEVIVVSNACSDNTDRVLESFASKLPLRFLREPTAGKNRALRTGMHQVNGDLVVFADDDAIPGTNWLTVYANAAALHPAHDIFGGQLVCRWPAPPPDWLPTAHDFIHTCFGCTDPALAEGEIEPLFLSGANFAVRGSALAGADLFDPHIGPKGASYAMGSEASLIMKLKARGARAWYVHEAIVEHLIRHDQLSRKWLLRRAMNSGRGVFRMWGARNGRKVAGVPVGLVRETWRQAAHWLIKAAGRSGAEAFLAKWYLYRAIGQLQECVDTR